MAISTVQLHPDLRGKLQGFIKQVELHDGAPSLSEFKSFHLDGSLGAREHVALNPDGRIVGYGQAAWHRGGDGSPGHWAGEIVVDPGFRDASVATDLIDALHIEDPEGGLTLWTRSEYVANAAIALGWIRQRELKEMHRSLPIEWSGDIARGFEVSTFRMGVDEAAWLEANNAAFTGHPENGHMTRRDLENRMSQSWFDPGGFFVAWKDRELVGSCWTKIHDDGVGEIYIIGVVPGWEGYGLGRGLVAKGLRYLGDERHLKRAMLFVEAENERAAILYRDLGFETTRTIRAYRYEPKT